MTAVIGTKIELDSRGVAWVVGANVKVIEVILDKISYGWSPEEIHFQHPNLSLAQIHAALAYYYENQANLDAQIEDGLKETDGLSSGAVETGLRRKLSALKRRT